MINYLNDYYKKNNKRIYTFITLTTLIFKYLQMVYHTIKQLGFLMHYLKILIYAPLRILLSYRLCYYSWKLEDLKFDLYLVYTVLNISNLFLILLPLLIYIFCNINLIVNIESCNCERIKLIYCLCEIYQIYIRIVYKTFSLWKYRYLRRSIKKNI